MTNHSNEKLSSPQSAKQEASLILPLFGGLILGVLVGWFFSSIAVGAALGVVSGAFIRLASHSDGDEGNSFEEKQQKEKRIANLKKGQSSYTDLKK